MDMGLINGGFVRGDKTYAVDSDITVKIIRDELPFPKHIVYPYAIIIIIITITTSIE